MSQEQFKFDALGKTISGPSVNLETFDSPSANVTDIIFTTVELTSSCPVTGQPDFYSLKLYYRPKTKCIESKSLKLYLWSFRDQAMFCETLSNRICSDIFYATGAFQVTVELTARPRGGIDLTSITTMRL